MKKAATRSAPKSAGRETSRETLRDLILPLCLGLWVALALLKFGNPVILDFMVLPPENLPELIIQPWPFFWACVISVPVFILAFAAARFDWPKRRLLLWLPALWFGWQMFAGARSVSPRLSNPTLVHFAIAVLAFYTGRFALAHTRRISFFWIPVILAFAWALLQGFEQHYGGLEATREAFYQLDNWREYPEEYRKKLATNRIFSTLVYPNAFAGAMLLLAPALLYQVWLMSARWPRVARGVTVGVLAYMTAACLVWTGSKGGWLVALAAIGAFLLQLPGNRKIKIAAVVGVAVIGLAAFFIQYSSYFQRGAPSVSARFIYWSAAWQTALDNPVFGTGPGTFAVPFAKIKPEGAEMARLTHNDYLEQASDSGWFGFILFAAFVFWSLFELYRKSPSQSWFFRLIWLGLFAWALQAFIEFSLYIPALAWTAFLLIGWGLGQNEAPQPPSKPTKSPTR